MSEFDRSLAKVLLSEGGYSNNPADPGGATMRGIIQRVYDPYRDRMKKPRQSVKNITNAEVSAIYKANYWDLAKCDQLPAGVSYVVFDGAVNSGPAQSIKWLQRALGVPVDGQIGPGTINAANNLDNASLLVDRICDQRLVFMKALKTWGVFGKGWAARVASVRATGKAWADGPAPKAKPVAFMDVPDVTDGSNSKALVTDAKPATALGFADGSTGLGVGGGGLTGYIASAKDQLSQFTGTHFIDQALIVLTLSSIALVGGGAAYRWYGKRQREKRADALDIASAPNTVATA